MKWKCKVGKYYTYPAFDKDSKKLKLIKDYIENGIYEPDLKVDVCDDKEIIKVKVSADDLQTIVESKALNKDKSKHIVEHLIHEMLSKDEDGNYKYPTAGERIEYLNRKFYGDDDTPSDVMIFFCELFEKVGRSNIQTIAELDNTKFVVKVNNGNPISRSRSPLSYLGSKIDNVYDSDNTVEDRIYRKSKEDKSEISLDELENITDINTCTYIKDSTYDDERLNNYIYLPDELKLIMMLLADYTHEEIIQILYNKYNIKLSKSQLRTKIKHIAKQLKNPITVVDKRTKKCCMCGEEKNITEFSKDKSKKDGYSPRCKQCDKERKKYKNKVGNLTKTA